MKFKTDTTWKHNNGRDAFIRIWQVSRDSGTEATLIVEWWIQALEFCGVAPIHGKDSNHQLTAIHIKPEEYPNWEPYAPRGTYS